ncbi:MAG: serine hydrolase, partial [Lysobacterales bacterium]
YDYDNLLYIVAGEVAAAAGGAPYETLVRREVFEPLGMSRCQVGEWQRDVIGNVAQAHRRSGARNVPIRRDEPTVRATTMDAAGGIRCSLNDMLTWVRAWLKPETHWLSDEQREALWTPHTPMPVSVRQRAWNGTRFSAYGYGWRLADVDGKFSVSHTGSLSGMYSFVTLMPERKVGFVILTNGEGDDARTVLNQVLIKHYTTPTDSASIAQYAKSVEQENDDAPADSEAPDTSSRRAVARSEMGASLGIYRDPWFGEVSICGHADRVRFRAVKSPLLDGDVMHVGQRLLVDWRDDRVDAEAWLVFPARTARGKPEALTLAKVDPDADFSFDFEDLAFERVRDCPP